MQTGEMSRNGIAESPIETLPWSGDGWKKHQQRGTSPRFTNREGYAMIIYDRESLLMSALSICNTPILCRFIPYITIHRISQVACGHPHFPWQHEFPKSSFGVQALLGNPLIVSPSRSESRTTGPWPTWHRELHIDPLPAQLVAAEAAHFALSAASQKRNGLMTSNSDSSWRFQAACICRNYGKNN